MKKEDLIITINGVDYMLFEVFTEHNSSAVEALVKKSDKHNGIIQKFDVRKNILGGMKSCDMRILIPVENAVEFAK